MDTEKLNKEFENAEVVGIDELIEQDIAEEPQQITEAKLDPEQDRDNWPTILIDMEDEKPNYEFLSTSGTMKDGTPFNHDLQVQRGIGVKVPPSIVHTLEEAVSTHYVQRRDPQTGKNIMIRQDRSAIPWRLVHKGKYIE